MKRKFTFLIATAVMLLTLLAQPTRLLADDETVTFPTSSSNVTLSIPYEISGTNVTVTFNKTGSGTSPATNTDGLRVYAGNTIQFSSDNKNISSIEFAYKRNKKQTNGMSASTGTFSEEFTVGNSTASNLTATWEAENQTTQSVTFTVGSGSGNYALVNAVVTFVDAGGGSQTHTLTFTADPVAGGTVTVNNSTSGSATIAENNSVAISAEANTGFEFDSWSYTGTGASVDNTSNASAHFTMGTADATLTANFAQVDTYTVTYKANGGTGDDIVNTYNEGTDVTVAANTFSYSGHAFTKWTTADDGTGDEYYPGDEITSIDANYTLYAQWETSNEVVDELTVSWTGVTGTTYTAWNNKSIEGGSGAVYAGKTNKNDGGIGFRTQNSEEGIITTTSGGYVRKVTVTWKTTSARTLQVYGKNTPYSNVSDLFSSESDVQGTLLGSITYGTSTELSITDDYLYVGLRSLNGYLSVEPIKITWEPDNDPAVATTVTIDDTDINNNIFGSNTNGGTFSAVVKDNENNVITGAAVTWESDDESVATINLNSGALTLVAEGTTTITASYVGVTNNYKPSSKTYELTVISQDPNGPGTQNNPYTVAQALEAIDALADNGTIANQYVTGIISQVGDYYSNYNSISYWISDDGGTTTQLYVYSGKGIDGASFSAASDLKVGDGVVIKGDLKKYVKNNSTTPEIDKNSQIKHLAGKPAFSPAEGEVIPGTTVTITSTEGATIYYTTNNSVPTTGSSVYSAPIEINAATTIKAIAVKGGQSSVVATATYTLNNTPTISVDPASLTGFTYIVDNGPSTTKTVSVSGANLTADITMSLGNSSDFEMSTTEGSGYTNSLTLTQDAGSVAATTIYVRLKAGLSAGDSYSGTITLTSTGASNAAVSLSGSVTEPVVDYATLPFTWDDKTVPTGITLTNTDAGFYASSPYIKLNQDGEGIVVLKLNAAPGTIVFDIKGNTGNSNPATGVFTVSTSADGTNYTTLATYSSIPGTKQTMYFTNLNADVRYIKWSYNKTASNVGNVALGNFNIRSAAEQSATWTAGDFTPVSNQIYVVNNGATLILNGDYSATLTNASNLIIEDGGQLITSNSVQATMKKTITGCTYENTNNAGYRLIASPINGAVYNNTAHTNLTGGAVGYDLYAYDAASKSWLNFKDDGNGLSTLNAGQGYLYANGSDMDLLFMGALNTSVGDKEHLPYDADNTLKSLYLAGNTLSHNETFYVYDDVLEKQTVNFLTINTTGDGFITTSANSFTAKAMQGFFVQSNGTDWTLSITNLSKSRENNNDKASMLNIMIVNNGDVIDNAIVSFCNAPVLNKFYLNENGTHVYIPKGNEDYAVVLCEGESQMPVNFKAAENGTYTIDVEAENLEVDYLHLIDNLTGMDVDLLATPSYTFEARKSDIASRFRLVFDANTGNDETNDNFAFINNGELIVNGNGTVQVIDILGRQMFSHEVNSSFRIQNSEFAPGVYVLRLVNGNDVKTQKIVIK